MPKSKNVWVCNCQKYCGGRSRKVTRKKYLDHTPYRPGYQRLIEAMAKAFEKIIPVDRQPGGDFKRQKVSGGNSEAAPAGPSRRADGLPQTAVLAEARDCKANNKDIEAAMGKNKDSATFTPLPMTSSTTTPTAEGPQKRPRISGKWPPPEDGHGAKWFRARQWILENADGTEDQFNKMCWGRMTPDELKANTRAYTRYKKTVSKCVCNASG